MSISNAFQRVLSRGIEDYHAPVKRDISDVTVWFRPSYDRDARWSKWRPVLEEWLPKFEKVGWLDDLAQIKIGDGIVSGDATGRYLQRQIIMESRTTDDDLLISAVLDPTRRGVLVHEMLHHAHLTLNDFSGGCGIPERQDYIRGQVSYYAGKNINETVAEIGSGIIFGREFPEEIHNIYTEYDGPQEVYNIG